MKKEIQKLGYQVGITDRTSNYYPPTKDEIVNKINEIIEELNKLENHPPTKLNQ